MIYFIFCFFFFFQAEDGIRDLVRSRGLGDVYKRQAYGCTSEKVDNESDIRLVSIVTSDFDKILLSAASISK